MSRGRPSRRRHEGFSSATSALEPPLTGRTADAAQRPKAQVSDLEDMLQIQFQPGNFLEWYFGTGRINLDFQFGRDSSALGDESLLAVTQNANVNVPVLCIGASDGLVPTEASYADYLGSVATPAADKEIFIAEGYAHLDMLTAKNNVAVPHIVAWANRLLQRKLLAAP